MLSQGEASLLHELEELRRQNADLRSEVAYLRGTSGAAPARPDRTQSPPSRREASILESATGYAIFSMDADGLITSWSEGARLIHGWTENEAVGRHTRLIFTPGGSEGRH